MEKKNELSSSLERCAYLLHLIASGDHKALDNAASASKEAIDILRKSGVQMSAWTEEAFKDI